MTQAEQISAQFGDDGQVWTDTEGRELGDVCEEQCVEHAKGRSRYDRETDETTLDEVPWGESIFDLVRYVFADGSAIVVAEGGWDIEGAEPFSWAGA